MCSTMYIAQASQASWNMGKKKNLEKFKRKAEAPMAQAAAESPGQWLQMQA